MNSLDAYLPQDRRAAIAQRDLLPDRARGAVLFADISGFTTLTEALTRKLGVRRGAEELTQQLNRVYDALIAQIENYGGSVITFSGDATTCWFAEPSSALRAVACAVTLQATMQQFAAVPLPDGITTALTIKVAIASGAVRRFVVGDPQIHQIDVIAGSPVARTATGEHLAQPGEILIDAATAETLAAQIEIAEWRTDAHTDERFAVLCAPHSPLPARRPPPSLTPSLPNEILKPWLHATIFERARGEGETFLTELRPVVALFARFQGIDMDADEDAGEKLDRMISHAQQVLARYDGALLELTIGDKGSYFYATFGAPHAHEDDARRAVYAAGELFVVCDALEFIEPLQIGISQGIMRVGGYGSTTRRSYGAQGDEVNLAARLMMQAAPGQLLISGRIQKAVASDFDLEPLPPIRLKGKVEPLLPFLVQGIRETRAQELQDAYYTLPMIGRESELAQIQEKFAAARRGNGQVIGITAPAGIGKSRLTAEVIRAVRRRGESSYSGECQSFGVNISYLVWVSIWHAFFGIDSQLPMRRQVRALENEIQDLAPERLDALPLLGTLLHIPLPENDFTRALEPEFRKSALEALLFDCVRAAAQDARAQGQLLLFVIEDAHWIDPASRALLEQFAASIAQLPIAILLTYRPPQEASERFERIEALSHFTEITLTELTNAQGEGLLRAKLAQYAPENTAAIPIELIARVTTQAQGNPFYIEQLVDFMHDRGINFRDPAALDAIELPNTLHRLILSRIDQLNETQQLTLKTASIIGRAFSLAHLCGYFPRVGSLEHVRADLERLQQYDLTMLEQSDPSTSSGALAYLFKHLVTHQVAYESLAYATRAQLHETYAQFLETHDEPARVLDLLAFHYDRSENFPKRRAYLRRAGEAAAARFANVEAVDYLTRALALAPASDLVERCVLLSSREQVYDVMGARDLQRADLGARETLALALNDIHEQITVTLRRGWLAERTAAYPDAIASAQKATALIGSLHPQDESCLLSEANMLWAQAMWEQGDPSGARAYFERALELARACGDASNQAHCLNMLGTMARFAGEFARARPLHEQALAVSQAARDRRRELWSFNNLAAVAYSIGDLEQAIAFYMDALQIVHEIGDRRGEATLLSNIAVAHNARGEYDQALTVHARALTLANAIADRKSILRVRVNLGDTYRLMGEYAQAKADTERALHLARELGDRFGEGFVLMNSAAIEFAGGEFAAAQDTAVRALELTRALTQRFSEAFVLNTLGQIALARENFPEAQNWFEQALAVWQSLEPLPEALEAHAGLAHIAVQRDDLQNAMAYTENILAYLDAHPAQHGDPAALAASLTAYRVLEKMNDARAYKILEAAHAALQARAEKIGDEKLRQSFLKNVRAHRELIQARRIVPVAYPQRVEGIL